MIRHLIVVIPLLVSGLAQASAQKVADPAVGEATTATSGPSGPRFEETGPQTSFTIGLIRSLFFSAVLFGEPWLEVSMERRLSHARSMGLIGGMSSWGHGDAVGSGLSDFFDLSGRRDYIGGYLRSNFMGSFHRNLHVSAEVELERLALDDGNQPFYGVVWGLLGGVKTSSPKGGLTTELQAGMRLSLHDKRPNLPFWPVVNLRMGLSF